VSVSVVRGKKNQKNSKITEKFLYKPLSQSLLIDILKTMLGDFL